MHPDIDSWLKEIDSPPLKRKRSVFADVSNIQRMNDGEPSRKRPRPDPPIQDRLIPVLSPPNTGEEETPRASRIAHFDGSDRSSSRASSSPTKSSRSRQSSPVKNSEDLGKVGDGIRIQDIARNGRELDNTIGSSLYRSIDDLLTPEGVVPALVATELQSLDESLSRLKPSWINHSDIRDVHQIRSELKFVLRTIEKSHFCSEYKTPEAQWNSWVHSPVLEHVFDGDGTLAFNV